ncbi:101_t:CDS:2, partial [Cetraspora pellucida]
TKLAYPVLSTTSLSISEPFALSAKSTSWFCKYNLSFARKSSISLPQLKNDCSIPAILIYYILGGLFCSAKYSDTLHESYFFTSYIIYITYLDYILANSISSTSL